MREVTNLPEQTRPTILLVEEDDDARPLLTKNLRELGYRLLVAAGPEDAREWVNGNGHVHADLVLINLVRRTPAEVVGVGRELREHAGYDGHTPLVVVAEEFPAEYAGTDENVGGNDWICYYAEAEQLRALLKRLTSKSSA